MKYSLQVTDETADVALVDIEVGSAALVSYAEKEIRSEIAAAPGSRFSVELRELDASGEPTSEALLDMTANGRTVGNVLKSTLAGVRKAERGEGDAPAAVTE